MRLLEIVPTKNKVCLDEKYFCLKTNLDRISHITSSTKYIIIRMKYTI